MNMKKTLLRATAFTASLGFCLLNTLSADLVTFEPFDLEGEKLDAVGSGTGWAGDWTALVGGGLDVATDGENLQYPDEIALTSSGTRIDSFRPLVDGQLEGAASERLVEQFSLANGTPIRYVSFLARRDATGTFRIETRRTDGLSRWGARIQADGSVGAKFVNWSDSVPGVFEEGKTYLVVSRFSPGSTINVKAFEVGVDVVPASDSAVEWDATASGGQTAVSPDRIFLAVSEGRAEIDELRIGTTWAEVVMGEFTPTFERWQETYFSEAELADPAISGVEAAPGGDGVANLMKYALFGSNPKEGISSADLLQPEMVGGEFRLSYPERPTLTDVTYTAEISNDLTTWSAAGVKISEVARVVSDDGLSATVTVAPVAPGPLAFEPFDFTADGLVDAGSGFGWDGDWFASIGTGATLAQDNGSLVYPVGSQYVPVGSRVEHVVSDEQASTRIMETPISFGPGNAPIYLSFLARRSPDGWFQVVTERSDGISRWGIDIGFTDGIVGARVGEWADSAPETFAGDTTYLVVSKFIPIPEPGTGASATVHVKVFETGVDTVPETDAEVEWDVTAEGLTGVSQDRVKLRMLAGTVEVDELRVSPTWGDAVLQAEEPSKKQFIRLRIN